MTLRPTAVFDTFLKFAVERQEAFLRKAAGVLPLTNNPILSNWKFTCPFRAADRTSQYLIQRVIYDGDPTPTEVVFRTILFKLFNWIGTWELLCDAFGEVRYTDFSVERYGRVLDDAKRRGKQLYTAAYRMGMTQGPRHQLHLQVLDSMMRNRLPERLQEQKTMAAAYRLLRAYPKVGDFIGYQLVTDLNYSNVLDFSEMEFVVPGPGALSGLEKCFGGTARGHEVAAIRWIAERQDQLFASRGLRFKSLWGRKLQLIDVQNLFCEVNKYARLAHPEIPGTDKQTKMKQRYRPDPDPLVYWFPPKWGINAAVERSYQQLQQRRRTTRASVTATDEHPCQD